MHLPKGYTAVTTVLLLVISAGAFTAGRRTAEFDEITVKKITVVDDEGRARVLLAGGYGPRRADLAGLLFINQEGVEAGELVYKGTRDSTVAVSAGAILTFDQFGNDQIVALSYDHDGGRKRQGLTIQDRPDSLTDRVVEAFRAVESATSKEERPWWSTTSRGFHDGSSRRGGSSGATYEPTAATSTRARSPAPPRSGSRVPPGRPPRRRSSDRWSESRRCSACPRPRPRDR